MVSVWLDSNVTSDNAIHHFDCRVKVTQEIRDYIVEQLEAGVPQTTVAAIQQWAGLPEDVSFFSGENRAVLSWERQHLFPPANEKMLAEKPTNVRISPREDWRGRTHRRTRWVASWLTFPDSVMHGYDVF